MKEYQTDTDGHTLLECHLPTENDLELELSQYQATSSA